jgi:tight adherence protein C
VFSEVSVSSAAVFVAASLGAFALLTVLSVRYQGDIGRGVARLRRLGSGGRERPEHGAGLGRLLARAGARLAPGPRGRARLEARLGRAGVYSPGALQLLLGARLVLTVGLPVVGVLILAPLADLTAGRALFAGAALAGVGLVAPGVWLDRRTRAFQGALRRGLPDALDLMVLCVEGGGSLTSAIQRVTEDLDAAHPELAAEMVIVQREMQMGLSAGESFKRFAERCGLDDVRELSAVVLQSERFGAGVGKALRVHADTCRQDRQYRAEEMAQKASVKILFPTLLCIFPAVFIVLLGPAAYQMANVLSKTR